MTGLSCALAARLARRDIHYAWVVAGVTFLTMLVTAGAVGIPGVLIGPLQDEFGWTTGQISAAFAVRLVLFGLMGPFAAALMNRFGLRPVIVASQALIAVGLLGAIWMTQLWQLTLLLGVVVGLGTGLTAMVLGATVVSRWFVARRGLVIGLLTASTATGQLVFLPVMAALTDSIGWRAALALSLMTLMLAAGLVMALMRDRPRDLGLTPFGTDRDAPPPPRQSLGAMMLSPLTVLLDAVRVPMFWLLFGTFFICGASTNGLVQTHFIALCGDYGMAAITAAGMLAVIGIFDFVGTVGSGWLSDRYDSRWLLFWYYGLRGLSLIWLPFSDFSLYALAIFAVFYGLDWVATVPPTVKLATEHFGERANIVFGWIFTGHQLGAATAAWAAGETRTALDSYLPAFFAAGVLCVGAALAIAAFIAASGPRIRAVTT
ncbi:MFS transporter (plasmid) [Paracoccus marcusii]|uniref:MFS transporter n=1 Tax=Paracoccus marcusii TaxID=59779 RepID=UPI0038BD04DB